MVDKINDELNIDMSEETNNEEQELSLDNFSGKSFVKNPDVGQELVLVINKVVENKNTIGKNKETGKEFNNGIKDKNDKIKRYDLHTDKGIYTISAWEVYFKLFDSRPESQGILVKYAKANNKSFKGAKISIKRLMNGQHAQMNVSDLKKIMGFSSDSDVNEYKKSVQLAMKEQRLYDIKLL